MRFYVEHRASLMKSYAELAESNTLSVAQCKDVKQSLYNVAKELAGETWYRVPKAVRSEAKKIKKQIEREERKAESARTSGFRARLRKFELSAKDYENFYTLGCWLCRAPFTDSSRVVIEHDHITGKVRGLAHGNCNTVIGLAKENADLLRRLADSLSQYQDSLPPTDPEQPL